jgi:V/A-type H+-transporting ATPase subunit I
MAKLIIKRIEITAPQDDREKVMGYLQRRGLMELIDCTGEDAAKAGLAESAARFGAAIAEAESALSVLKGYMPAKKGMLSSLSSGKREMEGGAFDAQAQHAEEIMGKCRRINGLRADVADAQAEIARLQAQADQMRPWEALDIPMDFRGTAYTAAFVGSVPFHCDGGDIIKKLAHATDMAQVEVVAAFEQQSNLCVICHRSDEEKVEKALRGIGFSRPDDPPSRLPAEQLELCGENITRLQKEIRASEEAIRDYRGAAAEIEFLVDYYATRKGEIEALGYLRMTGNVFTARGYIPEKYIPRVTEELGGIGDVAVDVSDPEEDEDIPVLLENNRFVKPVEGITELYALPSAEDIDPNPVMSFFYYFFFGMMLSDAGYGVLLTLGCAFALKKLNLTKKMRGNMEMFMYCGISTIFWGALYGSWFGDIVQVICTEFLGLPAPRLYIWMDPVADPMKLLLICFAFGIVHLFAGVAANFAKQWKAGRRFDAFADSVPVYLLVLGVAPMAAGILTRVPPILSEVGKWVALAGLILVILATGRGGKGFIGKLGRGLGLNGIYGIATGYLGDVISYSRLLALGLCTGIIASVMNMLGTIPSNMTAKVILLAVVFPVGHALNMAINVLGAYVHANRLQFVEMFGKFYDGGGRAFKPFQMETKYITFKEGSSQ